MSSSSDGGGGSSSSGGVPSARWAPVHWTVRVCAGRVQQALSYPTAMCGKHVAAGTWRRKRCPGQALAGGPATVACLVLTQSSGLLALTNRDVEAEEKQETPWAQQEQFEAEQIKKAATKFGAKDRKSKAGELGCEPICGCSLGRGRSRQRRPAFALTRCCFVPSFHTFCRVVRLCL